MLELRPNCECCDKDLPPSSTEACICTYECTFCTDCVSNILKNVCPNCGGGFTPRPVRPATARRSGVSLEHHPASTQRIHTAYSEQELKAFAAQYRHIPPQER